MTDIEQELISFFDSLIDGVKAYAVVPPKRPTRFITVERTGGSRTLVMDNGQFAIQVWAESRKTASMLAQQARATALALLHKPWCTGIELGGLYNFPDPDSATARYQFTLEVSALNNS